MPITYTVVNLTKTVQLTSAQILALHATPVTLLPAPGVGQTLVIDEIIWTTTFITAAYTGANNVEIRYTNGSGNKLVNDIPAAVLNIASGTQEYLSRPLSLSFTSNAPVVAVVPVANPAAGSGTVTMTINYRLFSF